MSDSTNPAGRPMVGKILSRDERDQMLVFHVDRCRRQQDQVVGLNAALEEPKQDLKDGQDVLKKYFDEAKADLGRNYSRKYLESLITDSRAKVRDLAAIEEQRAHDKRVLDQPVYGLQPELFPGAETPAEAKDQFMWEAEGFALGRRGALKEIPEGCPPRYHQDVLNAYERGQETTREQVAAAMEAKKRLGEPDAEQQPVDLNAATATGLDDEAIEDAAERLQRSGFMETGGEKQDEFEASADELSGQSTRKAVRGARKIANDQSAAA